MPQSISKDIVRVCKICGEEFHPTALKQGCCGREKIRRCKICGKEFTYLCLPQHSEKKTCSKKCTLVLQKQRRLDEAALRTRKCKWCGKKFIPTSGKNVYCRGPHYQKCVICGNQFEVDVTKDPYVKTCSKQCRYEAAKLNRDIEKEQVALKKTLLKKYGVENAMKIPGSIDKIKKTNLEKYGEEWYTQTEEYRRKVLKTSLEKYGVEHFLSNNDVIKKRVETVTSKYGVENVFQDDSVKEKSKQTVLNRYGVENVSQSDDVQKKIVENNLSKYGVKHPMMLAEFQEKARTTNIEKYGRNAFTQQHIERIQDWYAFINDPRSFIESHYAYSPRSEELAEDLGVDASTIDVYLNKKDAKDCVRRAKSLMEEELISFIKHIRPDIQIIQNDRCEINPLELDIYIPELKFAIECNPTCTHNSSIPDPWGGDPKPRKYHMNKTDICDKNNIFLFHIFGSDWTYRKSIIESMIAHHLGADKYKIFARNCKVSTIDGDTCKMFLEDNHRQGNAFSRIRLGLFHKGELVSVMTFGKMRKSIGTTDKEDLSDCYELVRFCSKLNTSVVGGASKLFKYFVKNYKPSKIISFSDRAHTKGSLYSVLGFEEVRRSDPGYVWVDIKTDKSYHRVNAQKQNIQKFLGDYDIDLDKTETQIMIEHGFVQMFDSGTITWRWKNKVAE